MRAIPRVVGPPNTERGRHKHTCGHETGLRGGTNMHITSLGPPLPVSTSEMHIHKIINDQLLDIFLLEILVLNFNWIPLQYCPILESIY